MFMGISNFDNFVRFDILLTKLRKIRHLQYSYHSVHQYKLMITGDLTFNNGREILHIIPSFDCYERLVLFFVTFRTGLSLPISPPFIKITFSLCCFWNHENEELCDENKSLTELNKNRYDQ